MANWYYYNKNSEKIGPIRGRELKQLAAQGIITPGTVIENEEGTLLPAGKSGELTFPETVYGMATPPPRPAVPNPFTAPSPEEDDSFIVPPEEDDSFAPRDDDSFIVTPRRTPRPPIKINWGPIWKTALCILLITIAGCVAWEFYTRYQFKKITKEAILEEIKKKDRPLEIIGVSVTPANGINIFTDHASGKFSAKTITKEKLYEFATYDHARQKLGVTGADKAEFAESKRKYQALPASYKGNLRMPQELSELNYYDLLTSAGNVETLTGSVELTKNDNQWEAKIAGHTFPYPLGIQNSKLLSDAHRLDEYETERKVKSIVGEWKTFGKDVDLAVYRKDETEKLNEAAKTKINEQLRQLELPLEISNISVKWAIDKSTSSVSEEFTVKAEFTEKFYQNQPVKADVALKELKITDPIPENLFSQFRFYRTALPNGRDVDMRGNIELTKHGEDWQVSSIRFDPKFLPENVIPEHELPPDVDKLDDTKTEMAVKEIVWKWATLKWQKNVFDLFCKGTQYSQKYRHADIGVNFRESSQDGTVNGTITFRFRDRHNNPKTFSRDFSVGVNTQEITDPPVTGQINNASLPGRNTFAQKFEADNWNAAAEIIKDSYSLMEYYTKINIQFTENKMLFSILTVYFKFVDVRCFVHVVYSFFDESVLRSCFVASNGWRFSQQLPE